MGTPPYDVPVTDVLEFNDKIDEYIETKMTIQQSAIEQALANFWEAIND